MKAKTNLIEKKMTIFKNIEVIYRIKKAGQCNIELNDKVQAVVSLMLPAEKKSSYLCDSLQFQHRLLIFDRIMYSSWGVFEDDTCVRFRAKLFTAEKYSEAFRIAEEYVVTEICKLSEMLAARENALNTADDI